MSHPAYCPRWLMIACLSAALAVMLGALGAHGLRRHLADAGKSQTDVEEQLDLWETAVRYHMYHALAMVVVALVIGNQSNRRAQFAGILFLCGILIFSGGLYGYVLTGIRPLALIVPLGGVAFIAGWLTLACSGRRSPST